MSFVQIERPNPRTPCVMWRVSVTLSASPRLPETRDKEIACCPARRAGVKQQQKNNKDKFLDVRRIQAAQRGRARCGDRQNGSEQSWQRRVG